MEYKLINGELEHRLNVEIKIGRKLTKAERVHHLDENKKNNNIENLMVFPSQKAHQSFHLKIKQFGFTGPIKRQIKNRWIEFKQEIKGFEYKCICEWSKDDEFGFIPNTECPVHGKETKKTLSKCVPIRVSHTVQEASP